jgi:hypothetical protein
VEVRRRVVFDGMGIRTVAGPQFGFASTQLLGVTGWNGDPDAVGTDFVRRGFYRTKPAAEEESATKTAWRISERLAEDSAPALDSVRQSAGRGLKRVQAGGMKIESLDFSTSASHLLASLRIGTPAAKISPPPPMPGDQDVGLRIHQSLVNEAARLAYGGRVVTVDKVSGFYGEVTQGFLRDGRTEKVKQDALKDIEKLIAGLAGQTTTIQLAKDDPILVAFIDGGFTIDVHIASIRQGKTVYSGTRIHAKYEFEQTKKAVHLVRKAPIKLVPSDKPTPGEQKIDTAPASFRLLQELLFAEVLKERLTVNELPMPDALRDVHFQAPRVGARDGWLGIGWNLASTSKK